ncbi:MAG: hypothetical protein AABX89_03585 [Candidatus Thermoplasmatota archaeon]
MTPDAQLAKLQSALAALLMEPAQLAAFQAKPAAYAKRRGLTGATAKLLAEMPSEGAAYFASRRVIDRFSYLSGDLPKSVAAVDTAVGLEATYFTERPYAKEDPRAEVRQFKVWAQQAARSGKIPRPLADLAAIEAGGMMLMDRAYVKPKRSQQLAKAPGIVLLRLRHDPNELLHGVTLEAPEGRYPTALVREPDDVEVYKLEPVAESLLNAATGKRTPDQVVAALAPRFGAKAVRTSLRDLRRLGLLAP